MAFPDEPPAGQEQQADDARGLPAPPEGKTLAKARLDLRQVAELVMMMDQDSVLELNAMAAEFCQQGKFAAGESCARSAARLAEQRGREPLALCDAYLWVAEALNGQARYPEALGWARKAYALADAGPLTLTSSASAAWAVATTLALMGRAAEAKTWKARHRLMTRRLHQEARARRRQPPSALD